MLVRECMHAPVVTCRPDTTLAEAALEMGRHNVGTLVVLDTGGAVAGIVTDRDIAVKGIGHGLCGESRVDEVMARHVATISDGADIFDVAGEMSRLRVRRLPVVNAAGEVKGMIAFDDLVLLLRQQAEKLTEVLHRVGSPLDGSPWFLEY